MPIFDHNHPITIKVTFSFHKFVSTCKKSAQFIHSFMRYSRFSSTKIQKTTPIFYHHHPKSSIWLSWIFINTPKTSLFHYFLFEIKPVLVSLGQSCHTHFWPGPPRYFWTNFRVFHQAFSTVFLIFVFWRYSQFKNPAIWLAKTILAHISGTRFFPSMGLVLEYSK